MPFNPLSILQLKEKRQVLKQQHPDLSAFGKELNKKALVKGSIFELRVTTPQGEVLEHKMTMTENDIEIIRLFVNE